MSDQDDFCPNCRSILNPVEMTNDETKDDVSEVEHKGLYMRCGDCNFSRPASHFSTTHFAKNLHKNDKSTLNMDPVRVADLIYDKTFPVTKSISCVNKKCPSQEKGINPEIVLLSSDKHPELGYLCSECKHIWGKF